MPTDKPAPSFRDTALFFRLAAAVEELLETNGGPIDADETVDGLAYVMVRRDAFDKLAEVFDGRACPKDRDDA